MSIILLALAIYFFYKGNVGLGFLFLLFLLIVK